ncbi:hypothetical protein D2E25_0966 [Bifidobacterium goeldii]|uniref:Uncharacterized protein n=1 Tax=Bifidobacterium goeldii TaxID=2306975 RepID=A0A430FL65_9BIFI|nr:hypothetical protein [Bifidobacterium goeldii]RSX53643.1 hypothetical protein D2E25_0966 [Bifidobacterium goeldii]
MKVELSLHGAKSVIAGLEALTVFIGMESNATVNQVHPGAAKKRKNKAPNHESACRRKGRSQRQKMEPGAMHGPTRISV